MKNLKELFAILLVLALIAVMATALVACNDNLPNPKEYRFAAPEGTPALAIARLVTDNAKIADVKMSYDIVGTANIAAEMSGAKADLVIMPVNAGAKLITSGADYKLVSVAVDGSLYLVGKSDVAKTLTMDDIKGKKIACIGAKGTPGLIFNFVMKNNSIEIVESGTPTAEQVFVQYVADGNAAKALIADNSVDFAVVGEPAATAFKGVVNCKAEMNIQDEYKKISGKTTYPQAGLFVRTSIAKDKSFMKALFEALSLSKEWVKTNANEVTKFAKAHLYESAVFPAGSIPRCSIDATILTDTKKAEVVEFLKAVMPNDSNGKAINWQNASIF